MFCTNCGARLQEGSKFCTNCDAPVAQNNNNQKPVAPKAPKAPKKANVKLYGIIGAAAVAVITLCLLLFTGGGRNELKPTVIIGNSKPIDVELLEGVRLTAPENALDKDRDFKLTAVSDKTFDWVREKMATVGVEPFMVFDLDAGMKPELHMPGDYKMVFDLNKMGIPRELQDRVQIHRVVNDGKYSGYYRYSTKVRNGILSFEGNQNSLLAFSFSDLVPLKAWNLPAKKILEFLFEMGAAAEAGHVRPLEVFYADRTTVKYSVKDDSGDFTVFFRYRDTEDADGLDRFFEKQNKFEEYCKEAKKKAAERFEADVKDSVASAQKGYSFWQKLFSRKQVQAIRQELNYESYLQKEISKDKEMFEVIKNPRTLLPKSIQSIVEQIIRANKYMNGIKLHKFDFDVPVYLVDGNQAGKSNYGVAVPYLMGGAFLLINYDKAREGKSGSEHLQCTIVHELFHARQQCYYSVFKMGSTPAECTAAVLEKDAAIKWYKEGVITLNNPESETAYESLLTERANQYIYSYPLDDINPLLSWVSTADAYAMACAVEGIRKGVGKDYLSMEFFANTYSLHGPHVNGWTGWIKKSLDINDEQLNQGWKYFGETHLQPIFDSQCNFSNPTKETETVHIKLTESSPVRMLERLKKPLNYAVNSYQIDLPPKEKDTFQEKANVFVWAKGTPNPYVTFYWSDRGFDENLERTREGSFLKRGKPVLYYSGNRQTDYKMLLGKYVLDSKGEKQKNKKNGYQLAVVTTSMSKAETCEYYVVGLFAPEAPNIRSVKDDKISFVVPEPDSDLTKNNLVSGAVVTYTDKNGVKKTHNIEPKSFGEKVWWTVPGAGNKGNGFTLSVRWYYNSPEGSVYESPEGAEAKWGNNVDKKEDKKEEVAPETNYWKQVSVERKIDHSRTETEGKEVDKDYRRVEIKSAGDYSLEITGHAATEEKKGKEVRYVKELYLDGNLSVSVPPKFWSAGVEYKGVMEIDGDPYLKKIKEGYEFSADIFSSEKAACEMSRKTKTDTGKSSTAGVRYLREYTGTFMAHHPEKGDPRSFTLTQVFKVAERPGSDNIAIVTYLFHYEWVGEEEPEEEEDSKNDSQIKALSVSGAGVEFSYDPQRHPGKSSVSVSKDGSGYLVRASSHSEYEAMAPSGYRGEPQKETQDYRIEIRLNGNMEPTGGTFSISSQRVKFGYLSDGKKTYVASKTAPASYSGSFSSVREQGPAVRHEYGMQHFYRATVTSYEGKEPDVTFNGKEAKVTTNHKTLSDLSNPNNFTITIVMK